MRNPGWTTKNKKYYILEKEFFISWRNIITNIEKAMGHEN